MAAKKKQTIQDIIDEVERARFPKSGPNRGKKVLLFLGDGGGRFTEFDYKPVRAALDYLIDKIGWVQAGTDTFSPAETMLFQLFQAHRALNQ